MTRTFSSVVVAILLVITASGAASAQVPERAWGGSPPTRAGTHFLVWHGGSVDEAAAVRNLDSLWVMLDGEFVGYFPSSPAFVNSAFLGRFPDRHLPSNTAVVVVIGQPGPGAVSDVSQLAFGETCVWCSEPGTLRLSPEGASVRINSVQISGGAADQFMVENSCTGQLRAPCVLHVSFNPFRPDRSDARLEVRHSGSNSPLVVSLSGVGTCERPSAQHVGLLDGAVGFGRDATGGADGCLVRVTSLEGRGPGSLREAAELRGPAWIVFDVSGTIRLDGYIQVRSDKTLDGRGRAIAVEGAGLALVDTRNVVITNLEIRDVVDDGLQIRGEGTTDVWLSHLTIWNVKDGYIDITQGAGDITVSWSRFDRSPRWPQEKVLLVGLGHLSHPDAPGGPDELTRVTVHHNLFNGTDQRSPLVRGATVHSFNNYFNGWGIYGSAVSSDGRLLSERNVYEYYDRSHPGRAFTPWDEASSNGGATAFIRSTGDRFVNGASGVESNPTQVLAPDYPYRAVEPTDSFIQELLVGAGAR